MIFGISISNLVYYRWSLEHQQLRW